MVKESIDTMKTDDGRRLFAFLGIFGGCIVFTIYIFISLHMLRDHPGFIFWLAVLAHVQVFVGLTAMGWALGRRILLKFNRDGATIDDKLAAAIESIKEEDHVG